MTDFNSLDTRLSGEETGDYRMPWFRDRSRIIHSSAFRRLQSKTQVLGLGESDFYRTRLTHTLEVANLAISITNFLKDEVTKSKLVELSNEQSAELRLWLPDTHLIEAISLAHDLGHPPFGHAGERALNNAMRIDGGFEGNGQTLRILSQLGEFNENGIDPTFRTILGVLKYPISYNSAIRDSKRYTKESENAGSSEGPIKPDQALYDWKPPKCYLNSEAKVIEKVLDKLPDRDRNLFVQESLDDDDVENLIHISMHKSLDCSIMDLADEISYAVHDLEDGFALRLIDVDEEKKERLGKVVKDVVNVTPNYVKNSEKEFLLDNDELVKHLKGNNEQRKRAITGLITLLIFQVRITCKSSFSHPVLKYNAELTEVGEDLRKFLHNLVIKQIIDTDNVKTLEHKAINVVLELFELFRTYPTKLLKEKTKQDYENAEDKKRVICDHIAGMTDDYAVKIYNRLKIPNNGSVFDRI